jgi:hypothetical protein
VPRPTAAPSRIALRRLPRRSCRQPPRAPRALPIAPPIRRGCRSSSLRRRERREFGPALGRVEECRDREARWRRGDPRPCPRAERSVTVCSITSHCLSTPRRHGIAACTREQPRWPCRLSGDGRRGVIHHVTCPSERRRQERCHSGPPGWSSQCMRWVHRGGAAGTQPRHPRTGSEVSCSRR